MRHDVDGLLIAGFGGPERPEDVMPFLRRVTAGRDVPDDRLRVVARQYEHFGGVSPLPAQNRRLRQALADRSPSRWRGERVFLGNRNSAPHMAEGFARMADAGVRRVAVLITSAFPSYSGCRQYREDLHRAQREAGTDMEVQLLPMVADHHLFPALWADAVTDAWPDGPARLLFVTHSLPRAGAQRYVSRHLRSAEQIVDLLPGELCEQMLGWELVYQSRSGPPTQPWLEPDIGERLRQMARAADPPRKVVVAPLGFVAENLEIGWDLDVTAAEIAAGAGIGLTRARPPQSDPRFTDLIWGLFDLPRRWCQADCCPSPWGAAPAVGEA